MMPLRISLAALLFAAAASWPQPGQAGEASAHQIALSEARVSPLPDGRIVVSFHATGDVRGLLTLTLARAADGQIGGEWVLVSRFLQDLDPDGIPLEDPNAGDHSEAGTDSGEPQQEYAAFVERGSLSGRISGGVLAFDGAGLLERIDALGLEITHGSLEFDGASGAGTAIANGLNDGAAASGSLSLAF